jgi:hypothetical protein
MKVLSTNDYPRKLLHYNLPREYHRESLGKEFMNRGLEGIALLALVGEGYQIRYSIESLLLRFLEECFYLLVG